MEGAWFHVLADTLGSVGAIAAGLVIWLTGWNPADPVASVLIGLLVLGSSWRLLSQAVAVLLEGVPEHLDVKEIRAASVKSRAWRGSMRNVTSKMVSLSAHAEREKGRRSGPCSPTSRPCCGSVSLHPLDRDARTPLLVGLGERARRLGGHPTGVRHFRGNEMMSAERFPHREVGAGHLRRGLASLRAGDGTACRRGTILLLLVPEHEPLVAGVVNISGAAGGIVNRVAEIFEKRLGRSVSTRKARRSPGTPSRSPRTGA